MIEILIAVVLFLGASLAIAVVISIETLSIIRSRDLEIKRLNARIGELDTECISCREVVVRYCGLITEARSKQDRAEQSLENTLRDLRVLSHKLRSSDICDAAEQ